MACKDVKEECIICQEEFGVALEIYSLPCQHKYHGTCISKWFSVNTSCPICRHPANRDKNDVLLGQVSDEYDDEEEDYPSTPSSFTRTMEQLNEGKIYNSHT